MQEKTLAQYLLRYPRRTIRLTELQDQFAASGYGALRAGLQKMLASGVVEPIQAGGGGFSGLPWRMRINKERLARPVVEIIQQQAIEHGFLPELDFSNYYCEPLAVWEHDLPYIEQLDSWLRGPRRATSRQQCSWDIFHDEKFLLGSKGQQFLKRLQLTKDSLSIVEAPDPLMMAVNAARLTAPVQHFLIVENKATYVQLQSKLPATDFAGLIFGYGWKIENNISCLPQQLGQTGCTNHRYVLWYFGDFDWEGLKIWQSLYDHLTEAGMTDRMKVQLAVPFYERFLAHDAPHGKTNQVPDESALTAFAAHFPADVQVRWREILEAGGYYPQEALDLNELVTAWHETGRMV